MTAKITDLEGRLDAALKRGENIETKSNLKHTHSDLFPALNSSDCPRCRLNNAAPELLDVLRSALLALESGYESQTVKDRARAVIAKAEGRAE